MNTSVINSMKLIDPQLMVQETNDINGLVSVLRFGL